MNLLELSANQNSSSVIKSKTINSENRYNKDINKKSICELHGIAKSRGLIKYYKLHKLLTALLEAERTSTSIKATPELHKKPPRRTSTRTRKVVNPVTIIPIPKTMDVLEKQEMTIIRQVVKTKLSTWYDWLIITLPKHVMYGV